MGNNDNITLIRESLRKLSKRNASLRPRDFIERLQKDTKLHIIEIREGLKALRKDGEIIAEWSSNNEPLSMIQLNLAPLPKSDTEIKWTETISESRELSDIDREALLGLHSALNGIEEADMRHLLAGLINLKNKQHEYIGQPMFNVSAEFLLGSSKLLGVLPSLSLKAFGIDRDKFISHPSYLVVAGPPNPKAVVLVENPHAFELAVSSGAAKEAAWIVTFGYGLSKSKEDYGKQLSEIVTQSTTREIKTLVRYGNPPPLEDLFSYVNLFFWGDLDKEGIRIYERIRKKLPQIRLSALYKPMIAAVTDSKTSHPYVEAVGKEGQEPLKDELFTAQLLKACEIRAVDQEIVKASEIINLYLKKLEA